MAKDTKKKESVDIEPLAPPEYINLTGHDVVDTRPAMVANLPVIDGEVGVVVFGKDEARKKMVADAIHHQLKNIGMPIVERHEFYDIGKSKRIEPEDPDSVLFMINQRNPRLFGTRVILAVDNIGQCLMSPDQRNIVQDLAEIRQDVRSISDFVESTDSLVRQRLPKTEAFIPPFFNAIANTPEEFDKLKLRAFNMLSDDMHPDVVELQILNSRHGRATAPESDVRFVKAAVLAAQNALDHVNHGVGHAEYVPLLSFKNGAKAASDATIGQITVDTNYVEEPNYNKLQLVMRDMEEAVMHNGNSDNVMNDLQALAEKLPMGVTIKACNATISNDEVLGPLSKWKTDDGDVLFYTPVEQPTYSCYSTPTRSDCRTKDSDPAFAHPGDQAFIFADIDSIISRDMPVWWKLEELYFKAKSLDSGVKVERRGAAIKNGDSGPYAEYKVDGVTHARF